MSKRQSGRDGPVKKTVPVYQQSQQLIRLMMTEGPDASSEFRRVMLNSPVLFSNNEQEAEWERWAGEKDGAGLPAVATVNSPDDDGRVGRKGNGKGADGVQ